jgi:hypothetical protein
MKYFIYLFFFSCFLTTGIVRAQGEDPGKPLPAVWDAADLQRTQPDSRIRTYVTPQRIVWKNTDRTDVIRNVENLLQPGTGQSILGSGQVCRLISNDTDRPAILLDFGKELQGGLQIVTGHGATQKPIRVRIRFGESVSEAMCEIDGKNGASNDHAMRDFTVALPWLGVAEIGNSGFRFVRIDLLDAHTELLLKEVRAIFAHKGIPYKGSFRCNDERLNVIWNTGAYTVYLNMQEYLWDGIKRDRLVWLGDMHPEVMTINTVFGYDEVVPKSLDLIRDATPVPQWMNGISSYSLWWIIIHRDWYYYQGKKAYLTEQRPYLTQLMNHLLTKIDEKGQEILDGHRFLDWPSSENPQGVNAGLQALMTKAMDCGEELFTILDDAGMATKCKEAAKRLRKYKPAHHQSKQGASLMALTGLMDAQKANKEVISVGGSENFSTFYGYYMLGAMAKAGDYTGALNRIREYWGGMLDLGATTFWEDFDIKWMNNAARIDELVPEGKVDVHGSYGNYCYQYFRHSLCHGWASGPTSWLSEHVLGVQVVEPGCKVIRIQPNLGDLQWVEGTFPTPYGVITIRHEKQSDGKIKSSINAPDEIKLISNP